MNFVISIDVMGLSQEVKNAITNLANSCWGENLFVSNVTVKATFDINGLQAFASGMADIQRQYNIK